MSKQNKTKQNKKNGTRLFGFNGQPETPINIFFYLWLQLNVDLFIKTKTLCETKL